MARISFYGGKGGVGKTTVAAARAVLSSESRRTLLVSTDPAHNLSDLFNVTVGSDITSIKPNLDALEIDPEVEARKYLEEVKSNISRHVRPALLDEVNRHIDLAVFSPGANESALFDRITKLILDESRDYDVLIFDTAPTGHTLRLITLPEMMGIWVDGLIGRRTSLDQDTPQWVRDAPEKKDPVLEKLQERKARFSKVREIIMDASQTAFWFVANPEKLSALETERAVEELRQNGVPLGGIIINKVLDGEQEGAFFQSRAEAQMPYIHQLRQIKEISQVIKLPLLDCDVNDEETFRQFIEVVRVATGKIQ